MSKNRKIRRMVYMITVTVSTKEELKKAKADGVEKIIVVGKLAKDLYAAQKITTLSKASLAVITGAVGVGVAGLATAPLTGGVSAGVSVAALGPVAATTGVSIPALVLAATIGVGFIIAIYKDYRVEIVKEPNSDEIKLVFDKK